MKLDLYKLFSFPTCNPILYRLCLPCFSQAFCESLYLFWNWVKLLPFTCVEIGSSCCRLIPPSIKNGDVPFHIVGQTCVMGIDHKKFIKHATFTWNYTVQTDSKLSENKFFWNTYSSRKEMTAKGCNCWGVCIKTKKTSISSPAGWFWYWSA